MSSATAPIPPDSGAIRFNRLQFGVVVVGVLLICAFAGSSAYDAWRSYRYSIAATERARGARCRRAARSPGHDHGCARESVVSLAWVFHTQPQHRRSLLFHRAKG